MSTQFRSATRQIAATLIKFAEAMSGHPVRNILVAISLIALGYLLYALSFELRHEPNTLSILDAKTEIVTEFIVNPEASAIPLNPARISAGEWLDRGGKGQEPGGCESGMFFPAQNARATLTRGGDSTFRIRISLGDGGKAGTLVIGDQTQFYREPVTLTFDDATCKSQSGVRVPLAGPVIVGADYGPQHDYDIVQPILLEGKISIFGRAMPIPPLGSLGDYFKFLAFGDLLFPLSTDMKLPAGSQLRDCDGRASWWGYAEARPLSSPGDQPSIQLELTTDATRLALTTPGGAKVTPLSGRECSSDFIRKKNGDLTDVSLDIGRTSADDILGVSFFTRMTADPYFTFVWMSCGLVFVIVQAFAAFHSMQPHKSKKVDREETP